jgi:hypothetical protein
VTRRRLSFGENGPWGAAALSSGAGFLCATTRSMARQQNNCASIRLPYCQG